MDARKLRVCREQQVAAPAARVDFKRDAQWAGQQYALDAATFQRYMRSELDRWVPLVKMVAASAPKS